MPVKRQVQYLKLVDGALPLEQVLASIKSWEILEIGAYGVGAGQGINVVVDGVSTLFLPVIDTVMGIGAPPWVSVNQRGFYEQLQARFPDIPRILVGQGEQITITRENAASACTLYMWYRELESPDAYDPTALGGSKNPIKIFNSYIRHSDTVAVSSTEEFTLDTVLNPAGYRNFPIDELVQKGQEYDFLGLTVFADLSADAADLTCNGIQVWHEDESILGQEQDFVPIDSFPIQGRGVDSRLFLLPEPRVFSENERMEVRMRYTNVDAVNPNAVVGHVGLIFRVRPV